MVVCQEQSSQPAEVTNILHAFDEIFAEVERIELSKAKLVPFKLILLFESASHGSSG